ncbi:MAG TPA: alpha-L-arabinofuranosidase C-terminal domain-containing protein, partial [Candidatus Paceibacterota bacterium]|nr:alpha-L-arabinofuranosidase C-terminal domain-containing protein [Candidatus Paceibacterota bacterium]
MEHLKSKIASLLFAATMATNAAPANITIQADKPGHKISPTLWGIFFEDINLSADGGIYPELVRNRSFEDGEKPQDWKLVSGDPDKVWAIDDSKPLNPFNRRSLRLNGACDLENEGYWGMNFIQGDHYAFKVAARADKDFKGSLKVNLCDADGNAIGSGEISGVTGDWKYYTLDLVPSKTDAKGKLKINVSGDGTVFLDMVSLLPVKTWKGHGLRTDLAESIDALKPSFVRFPGGCWVEGDDMAHMNHWKNTIGNVDVRTPLWNIWGYNATHGLGFHEYLQVCEDLGAEPLFCINIGMSHKETIPMDRMGQWVQDALDALEYANGPTNSVWGSLRAKNGHPAPFGLKYMEIGNENGGSNYIERWPLFVQAINQKYPGTHLIANDWAGGHPKEPAPEIVDEHYYETPESFMRRATMYDKYDRKGPKIFVGEYAVTKNAGKGNLRAALGEAAFMTGMERNSDIVAMASYAPLFVNLNHRAWNPDLINFDSAAWYGLPGYYVQQMFSLNRGDVVLPTKVQAADIPTPPGTGGIGVGTWNTASEFKDIKVTAPDGKVLFQSDFSNGSNGWKFLGEGEWKVQDGALRQTAEKSFVRAIIGDKSWTDYTIDLKARKISGQEGFLILFHIKDDEDRTWWNVGGWGNTQNAVELDQTEDSKAGSVETGRWYDLRVEVKGDTVKGWLDGKLINTAKNTKPPVSTIYATASLDNSSNEIIVKVVNTAAEPIETTIDLKGAKKPAQSGKAIVLTSANPTDENSLAEPAKVSPKVEELKVSGTTFTRSFPANSFTV